MTMRFPPLHLLFLTMLVRSATRLVALPNSHPLYKPLQLAVKRTAERHRSPLHLLFFTTGAKLNPSEITTPARRRQNYKMLGDVNIEEDRNTAINNAHQISGTAIFTDGSGYDKKIGAAAVMMKDGKTLKTLRYHLGADTEHTVHEAESVAVTLALHMLAGLKKTLKEVTIGMDDKAVLSRLQSQKSTPRRYPVDKIHEMLEDFQVAQARMRGEVVEGCRREAGKARPKDGSKERKLKEWCKVMFVWTPGHEDIDGNKRADKAAKSAAQGHSSATNDLPAFLQQKPLPVSNSATRQPLKKATKT